MGLRNDRQKMEGVTLLGGTKPCISSSSILPSSTNTTYNSTNRTLSSTSFDNVSFRTSHLSSFRAQSHLFSFIISPSRLHVTKPHKLPRIFLPHLVASVEQVEETYIMVKPDGVQRGLD